jgi:hypothetical protein
MALILKWFKWGLASSPYIVSGAMFIAAIIVCVGFIFIRDFVKTKFLKA